MDCLYESHVTDCLSVTRILKSVLVLPTVAHQLFRYTRKVPRVDGAFSALYSHIDSVSRLLELGIRGELLVHRTIAVFLLHHALKACGAGTVDLVLMLSLEFLSGVTENLAISILLRLLGNRKAGIKPILVVLDKRSVAAELVIE